MVSYVILYFKWPLYRHNPIKLILVLQRHKVNAICWSKVSEDIVVSGDEIGNLVIWDIKCNTTRHLNFGKHCIFVLQANPFNEDIVAFGCRLGLVFIVNITGKYN